MNGDGEARGLGVDENNTEGSQQGEGDMSSSEDSYEWVYFDEVECAPCPSSQMNGLPCGHANGIDDGTENGDQWEYYDEQDVSPQEDADLFSLIQEPVLPGPEFFDLQ